MITIKNLLVNPSSSFFPGMSYRGARTPKNRQTTQKIVKKEAEHKTEGGRINYKNHLNSLHFKCNFFLERKVYYSNRKC